MPSCRRSSLLSFNATVAPSARPVPCSHTTRSLTSAIWRLDLKKRQSCSATEPLAKLHETDKAQPRFADGSQEEPLDGQ